MLPKVILDTDIGDDIDDSFALLLAVLSKKMDIIGVTTCFRNSVKRAKIAKALLMTINQQIEVYPGEDLPLNGNIMYADFDQFDLAGEAVMPYYFKEMESIEIGRISALDFMMESIEKYPNEITIISIGPLTNLAKLLQTAPKTYHKIREVVFMGGQPDTNFKEWNVRCDVEATNLVFHADVPLKIVGLNVTSKCNFDQDDIKRVFDLKDTMYAPLLKKMFEAYLKFFDYKRNPVMHDPLTIACQIDSFCTFKPTHMDVIVHGQERGRTIIDSNNKNNPIQVATDVNPKALINYLFDTLES